MVVYLQKSLLHLTHPKHTVLAINIIEPLIHQVIRQHVERIDCQMILIQPRPPKHLPQCLHLPILHLQHGYTPLVLQLIPHKVHKLLRAYCRHQMNVIIHLYRPIKNRPQQSALGLVLHTAVHGNMHIERAHELCKRWKEKEHMAPEDIILTRRV